MSKLVITAIGCLIIAGLGGFFAGMQYQKSQQPSFAARFGNGNGQFARRFGQNGQNFMPVRGQVLSVNGTTLTIKLANGNSQLVVLAPSTQFVKTTAASTSDVKIESMVVVLGTKNSDGSVTAQDVQIIPKGMIRPSTSPAR